MEFFCACVAVIEVVLLCVGFLCWSVQHTPAKTLFLYTDSLLVTKLLLGQVSLGVKRDYYTNLCSSRKH